MKNELHLTKKDFRIDWYSGSGAGGQHRNKHQNCCRITHIETGLVAVGTESRDRISNQARAFKRLVDRILAYYESQAPEMRARAIEVIRTYHAERNDVHDKASGLHLPYRDVVTHGDLSAMIEARRNAKELDSCINDSRDTI